MRRTKAVDNFLNFFPVMDTNHAVCFCVKTNIVWCCHQDLLVLPTFKVMNSIINEDIASYMPRIKFAASRTGMFSINNLWIPSLFILFPRRVPAFLSSAIIAIYKIEKIVCIPPSRFRNSSSILNLILVGR